MSRFLQSFFAVVGIVASVIGIYQFLLEYVFEKKSISAAYKVAIISEPGTVFDPILFLRSELVPFKRIAELSVLVWNSGRETIPSADVRRDFVVRIDQSSKTIIARRGIQKASLSSNFELAAVENNGYKITWKDLDPGEYFEVHFLIATNLDNETLDKIMQIEGSIIHGARIKVKPLYRRAIIRDVLAYLGGLGVIILFVVVGIFGALSAAEKIDIDKYTPKSLAWAQTPAIMLLMFGLLGLVLVIAAVIVLALGAYLDVPGWETSRGLFGSRSDSIAWPRTR